MKNTNSRKAGVRIIYVWYTHREYSPLARGVRKALPCLAERPARVRCVRISFLYLRSQFACASVQNPRTLRHGDYGTLIGNRTRICGSGGHRSIHYTMSAQRYYCTDFRRSSQGKWRGKG